MFQWILANQSQYRDNRVSELIRLEHLYWHGENMDTENIENDESENRMLTELSTDTLTRLNQISTCFEDLKRYLRNYDIETALAKDLLERLNLIMISQNRIRDHLCRFI